MGERLHLLQQRRMVFEGRPTVWHTQHESLAPPADDQPRPRPTNAVERAICAGLSMDDIAQGFNISAATLQKIRGRLYNRKPRPAPTPAQSAPVPALAPAALPAPVLAPWQANREPVRACHVLDWADRMRGWNFEDNYQRPKAKHAKHRMLTRSQLDEQLSRRGMASTTINP